MHISAPWPEKYHIPRASFSSSKALIIYISDLALTPAYLQRPMASTLCIMVSFVLVLLQDGYNFVTNQPVRLEVGGDGVE